MDIPEIGAQFWESKIREDSIAGFLNDKLILDPLGQVSIGDSPNAEGSLYQAYHQYCLDQNHKPQAVKNFSPNLIECAAVILGWQVEKVHTKIGKTIKGIRIRTKADEHLPTYDYELRSRCEKPGDGFGDGSVTDSVTGQNLEPEPIIASVTDSSYSQVEKNIKNNAEENFDEIISTEVSINPSPENTPLPVKVPNPSPQPSPQPSSIRHPQILEVGDQVEIIQESSYQGQKGEIADIGHGARELDYYVKLDTQKVIVSIPRGADSLSYLRKL
jgi:putative DNA primase/helicase